MASWHVLQDSIANLVLKMRFFVDYKLNYKRLVFVLAWIVLLIVIKDLSIIMTNIVLYSGILVLAYREVKNFKNKINSKKLK